MTSRAGTASAPASSPTSRSKQALRLWLRLLSCENTIEQQLRQRLRERFNVTLPQFDVLAELEHSGKPMTMSALSRDLMVSNGNITGVVDRLVRDSYVRREASTTDRRVQYISLTEDGLTRFQTMAAEHERWVVDTFSGLANRDMEALARLLRKAQENA